MKRNALNVFQKSSYKWWRIWDRIKFHRHDLKFAWQRITKGYCDSDTWNLDHYYKQLLIDTLTYFKDNLHGAPVEYFNQDSENEEEQVALWRNKLEEIITCFKDSQEPEDESSQNEWANAFHDINPFVETKDEQGFTVWKHRQLTHGELRIYERYRDREKELYEFRKRSLKKGFKLLLEHFDNLWD